KGKQRRESDSRNPHESTHASMHRFVHRERQRERRTEREKQRARTSKRNKDKEIWERETTERGRSMRTSFEASKGSGISSVCREDMLPVRCTPSQSHKQEHRRRTLWNAPNKGGSFPLEIILCSSLLISSSLLATLNDLHFVQQTHSQHRAGLHTQRTKDQ